MIFPDFAFGHDHRDYFSAAIKPQGGEVIAQIADSADRDLLHPLLPADPGRDRSALPRHGRPGGPDLRQGTRRVLRLGRETADLRLHRLARGRGHQATAGSGIPRRHAFLGGASALQTGRRIAAETAYRAAVGVDDNGASVSDPADISTYSHMFSVWETLSVIKAGMEASGYAGC
jgi:branched-chain amino acid transport system substrate-binding protein